MFRVSKIASKNAPKYFNLNPKSNARSDVAKVELNMFPHFIDWTGHGRTFLPLATGLNNMIPKGRNTEVPHCILSMSMQFQPDEC